MLRYTMSKPVLEGSTCSGTFRSQLSRGSTCAGMAADSSQSGYFNIPQHSGFLGVNMLRNIQPTQLQIQNIKNINYIAFISFKIKNGQVDNIIP